MRSVLVQEKGFDLNVDLVKVQHHLVVDSGGAVFGSCRSLVNLIGSRD